MLHTASKPMNAKKHRLDASKIAEMPFGANGVRLSVSSFEKADNDDKQHDQTLDCGQYIVQLCRLSDTLA